MKRTFSLIALLLAGLLLAACSEDSDEVELVDHSDQTRFELGDDAPGFVLPATTGETVTLADYRNQQPVLLFFHMAEG